MVLYCGVVVEQGVHKLRMKCGSVAQSGGGGGKQKVCEFACVVLRCFGASHSRARGCCGFYYLSIKRESVVLLHRVLEYNPCTQTRAHKHTQYGGVIVNILPRCDKERDKMCSGRIVWRQKQRSIWSATLVCEMCADTRLRSVAAIRNGRVRMRAHQMGIDNAHTVRYVDGACRKCDANARAWREDLKWD